MILQFRTERSKNGECLYLAIDTGAECFSTTPHGWIDKDIPTIKRKDYRSMVKQCMEHDFTQVAYM